MLKSDHRELRNSKVKVRWVGGGGWWWWWYEGILVTSIQARKLFNLNLLIFLILA